MTLKTTTKTIQRGIGVNWTVIEEKDGVQRSQCLYQPGNDKIDEPDVIIWTSKWCDSVFGSLKGDKAPRTKSTAVSGFQTKDQCFVELRRRLICQVQEIEFAKEGN